MKKNQFCREVNSPWTRRLLHSVPIALSLFVAISSAAEAMAANVTEVSASQQVTEFTGTVVDVNGDPLIGVNVVEKGTENGAITDFEANFTLSLSSPNAVLVFSYIGYVSQEVSAKNQNGAKIVLKEDTETLDEVVVIGYGAVRKADVAGAVAVLDNKSFKDQPITQVSDALQGRVSGVQVENSGVPGGSVKIRVRGSGSINKSNDPLYVVDGIVRESGLDGINPEDIQSMQVLKDASSTAIYGSRGSNGVVLVTTKTGLAGATQVTLDASFGVANVYKRYDLLNSREYAQALVDAGKKTQDEMSAYLNGTNPGIDWQDEIFRTGITQNYKVAVSSGNDKTQFYLSGNYMGQTGVVIESKNERYQAKANVTSQVTPWLHVTADVNASHNIRKGGSFATGKDNPIWIAMNYSPTMQMMDGNNYAKDPINSIASNPVGILRLQGGETMTDVFTGHVDLRFNLAKGLTFTTTNGVDYYDAKSYSFSSKRVNPSNSMGNSDTYRMMLQSSNNFTYMGKWNKHSLTATAVYEVTKYEERLMNISGKNLLTESVGWWDASMAQSRDVSNGIQNWALVSGVARVMYNYNDRYQLTGTFRADGSSRFSKNKWGFFPSVAAAWTISNEKFMKNVKAVQDLKLRASFGIVGNQAIDPYYAQQYIARFGFDPKNHPPLLTMALGVGSVTPWEMVAGYSVFANGGYLVQPYLIEKVTDAQGNVLMQSKNAKVGEGAPRVIDARNAYVMHSLLHGVAVRGTGRRAGNALKREDMGVKTGTTNDALDAWFAGYAGEITAVGWMGYDQPKSLGANAYGAGLVLPVWVDYMKSVLKNAPEYYRPQPADVVEINGQPFYADQVGDTVQTLGLGETTTPGEVDPITETIRDQIF